MGRMIWERNGDSYTATVETPGGQVRYRLVVERLTPTKWDWAVREPGKPPMIARYGTAPTTQEPIQAAERAAR